MSSSQELINSNKQLLSSYFSNIKVIDDKIKKLTARRAVVGQHKKSEVFNNNFDVDIAKLIEDKYSLKTKFLFVSIDRFVDYRFKNSDKDIYSVLLKDGVDVNDIHARENHYLEKTNNIRIMKAGAKKSTYILPLEHKPDYVLKSNGSFEELSDDELCVVIKPEINAFVPSNLAPRIISDKGGGYDRSKNNQRNNEKISFSRSNFGSK